ncbi:MAG: NAD-binding protein [Candidatus Accumulibacter propinquus]|jgi:hypothetical protein
MAGLQHRSCRGVLAMTDDDAANLAVAIASRLINPRLMVVARVASPAVERNMMSFGTHYVVNHFEKFRRLSGAGDQVAELVPPGRSADRPAGPGGSRTPRSTRRRLGGLWLSVASGRRWCAISNGTACA